MAALAWLATNAADAQSSYAGTYQASPATMTVEVSTWGEDCGVQPKSQVFAERPTVEVRERSAQLEITFPGRVLRTDACWSQNPAVKLVKTNAARNLWRVNCSTPDGDPKREFGRYSVLADTAYSLQLVEESDYVWQLKESRCVAKLRLTQRLERPQKDTQPASAEAPAHCVPGRLTRLRLRPGEAKIQPGQRVCFNARGFDEAGCATDVDPKTLSWVLEKPPWSRATLSQGCFKAGDSAAEAEGTFKVHALQGSLRDDVKVTVAVQDLSDITAHRDADGSGSLASDDKARGAGLANAGLKAVGVAGGNQLALAVGLAGVAALLAVLAWFVAARRRAPVPGAQARPPASSEPNARSLQVAPAAEYQAATTAEAAAPTAVAPAPAMPPGEPMICPTCRRGYAPGSQSCSADGTVLVPYATFTKEARAATPARKCRQCGQNLAPEAAFCGVCGSRV